MWGRFDLDHRRVWRRALIVVGIGWLPLLLLALVAHLGGAERVWRAFLGDASVHARALLAAPLLVLAEAVCIPRLGEIARTFRQRGVVPDAEADAYRAIVRSIRRWRDSWAAEAGAVLLAYLASFLIVSQVPSGFLPDWQQGTATAPLGRSLASWWHALVTLPLLLVLLLGWLWRLWLWARFLWRVSRLRLRLVAAHPEGAGGLMFVGFSLRSFALPGLAIGILVSATEAAHIHVASAGADMLQQLVGLALGTVAFAVLLFALPLLAFVESLLRTWRAAVSDYGALTQRVGEAFEAKWMHGPASEETDQPLATGDFSAVTDLYQTAGLAYAMKPVPIHLRSLLVLAVATALPFGLVALTLLPMDRVLQKLVSMFL